MWQALIIFLITSVFVSIANPAFAIPKEVVESTKKAVAYIEVSDGSGTAFQIDPAGYFITNQHVVEDEKTVKLVLNSGEANQETVTGHVVRTDKDLDFALIKADNPAAETLSFGQDSGLYETLPVTTFGFPLGKDILLGADGSPSVSINTGHVSALRRDKDGLEMIQLDADINPGNSGGPVVDDAGHVLGVVEAGIEGASGLNFAIPVGILKSFLFKPYVSFAPEIIPKAKESEETVFNVKITSFQSVFKPSTVTVTFEEGTEPKRTFIAISGGDSTYSFSAVLVPKPVAPIELQLDIKNREGELKADANDTPVKIGGRNYNLSEFSSVFPSGSSSSELASGGSVSGRISGLPTIKATISGITALIDLSSVDSILIAPLVDHADSVHYEIRFTDGGSGPPIEEGDITVGESGESAHDRAPILSDAELSTGNAPSPIDVTGYTANVVTARELASFAVESVDYGVDTWFQSGSVDENGNQHDDGLVAGSMASSCDNPITGGNTIFWLQPFDRPNALLLSEADTNTGSFVLRHPRRYRVLAVLACAYNANPNSTGTLVVDFTDGSHSDPIEYNAFDWCTGPSNKAVSGRGRNEGMKSDGSGFEYVNGPAASLYETDIDLEKLGLSSKSIKRIAFEGIARDGLPHHPSTTIFALSGVPL